MMKLQAGLSAGLAVLLVAPSGLIDDRSLQKLEGALDQTTRAIEVLTGLRERQHGDVEPALLRKLTEDPILDERGRDERLQGLRNDVGLLQSELDALEGGGQATAPSAPDAPAASGAPDTSPVAPPAPPGAVDLPVVTTGFDDGVRHLLASLPDTPAAHAPQAPAPSAAAPPAHAESEDYSADPVLEARACLFAGRYERGLQLVEPRKSDPEALYWKARLLEKLGRLDESIDTLQSVAKLTDGPAKERAETDLEFLEWQRGFERRLKAEEGGGK